MIRQFAAGLLELAAEALRPPVPTQGQEQERARLLDCVCELRVARDREKARADAA